MDKEPISTWMSSLSRRCEAVIKNTGGNNQSSTFCLRLIFSFFVIFYLTYFRNKVDFKQYNNFLFIYFTYTLQITNSFYFNVSKNIKNLCGALILVSNVYRIYTITIFIVTPSILTLTTNLEICLLSQLIYNIISVFHGLLQTPAMCHWHHLYC